MLHLSDITNTIFTSKTYILSSDASDAMWMVDCGDFDKVEERIGERPIAVVLRFLFSGDAYIPGVKVVTNLPAADKQQAQESVARILELAKGRAICPGHST